MSKKLLLLALSCLALTLIVLNLVKSQEQDITHNNQQIQQNLEHDDDKNLNEKKENIDEQLR